eukprot:scaffold33647_cov49-Attheya_sp.AAC.1
MMWLLLPWKSIALFFVLLLMKEGVAAVPAFPHGFTLEQPDGNETTQLFLRGDHHHNYIQDPNGFGVVKDQDGWYMYADIGGESSGLKVGVHDPESLGLERKLKALAILSQDGNTQLCSYEDSQVCHEIEEHSRRLQEQTQRMIAVKNEIRNLVVPIRFSDHLERELPSVSELDALFNTIGGDATFAPTGSLKDVFLSNSYGKLVVQSHIMDWVTVSNTEAYYANGQSGGGRVLIEAFREALDKIEDKMNIGRLVSLSHEMGHILGLKDLYDKKLNDGGGVGYYDLMSNMWGSDYSGFRPPYVGPWGKMQLDWASSKQISKAGLYTIKPSADWPDFYTIHEGFPHGEYLIIENRQPLGFESHLDQGGLAIWHIDESSDSQTNNGHPWQDGWPENGNHYKVALLQADRLYNLERGINRGDASDLWNEQTKTEIGPGRLRPDGPNSHRIQFPNTDSYKNGLIKHSGVRIFDIKQEKDHVMSFRIAFDFAYDVISTDDKPSIMTKPTYKPTARPTARPTATPTDRPTTKPTKNRVKTSKSKPTYKPTATQTATQTRSPVSSYSSTGTLSNSNDELFKEIVWKFAESNDPSNYETPRSSKDDLDFIIEMGEKQDLTLLIPVDKLQEDFDILNEMNKEPASFAKMQWNPTISTVVAIACSVLSIYCNIL